MYNIQTYNNIAIEGLQEFDKANYILNDTKNPDALILRSYSLHGEPLPENLKAVARAGAGVNNIPVDDYSKAGIVVFNTPGANANAVKELVFAAMITSSRNMFSAKSWVDQLETDDISGDVEANKKQFKGTELAGKTLGVIGLGSIGHMVANDAYNLGMNVIGFDPYISVEAAWKISQYVDQAQSVEEVLQKADYLTIHVPATSETKNMIDVHALKTMKDNVVLMNFARSELVDSKAVVAALNEGRIGKYITDFPSNDLVDQENVLLFPHLGASTEEAETNCAIMAAKQLVRYLETGEIVNSVNFPKVEMPFNSPTRLSIVNLNVPNMIGGLSNLLSEYDINIDRIINKSRGDYAYTLVDIIEEDESTLNEIVDRILSIDGILSARLIKQA